MEFRADCMGVTNLTRDIITTNENNGKYLLNSFLENIHPQIELGQLNYRR